MQSSSEVTEFLPKEVFKEVININKKAIAESSHCYEKSWKSDNDLSEDQWKDK